MKLIEKYNKNVPRYTSYPPVPFWSKLPNEHEWITHIKSQYNNDTGLDLYIHVPFCEKLCYYCGCNRVITKNHGVEDEFVELILKQWANYVERLGFLPKINSLHFGGGTPTFLSSKNLKKLINELTLYKSDDFKGSIEIDPRTTKLEHLDVFKECGIKRISLGIQDFDFDVQKSINRIQPFSLVKELVEEIRKRNFESINFDLIYGLPKQTIQTVKETIELVSTLSPDMIAFYNYAHLPDKIKNQRLIKEAYLPAAEEKKKLYELGKECLVQYGYDDIGMDHFAKPNNYLNLAKKSGNLHRNFMGYTDKKSSVLVGLGPTAISDSGISFVQNVKDYNDFKTQVNEKKLAYIVGHTLEHEEKESQKIILDLMCNEKAKINFRSIPYTDEIKNEIVEFQNDGLLNFENNIITVTDLGRNFLRNIASIFDYHLRIRKHSVQFSKTI